MEVFARFKELFRFFKELFQESKQKLSIFVQAYRPASPSEIAQRRGSDEVNYTDVNSPGWNVIPSLACNPVVVVEGRALTTL